MMVYKKAKTRKEATRLRDFLHFKGFEDAEIEENDAFMSGLYPYNVVGEDEDALGLIERHESIVNVATGNKKRESTWMRSKDKWNRAPKRIRT